MGEIRMGIVSPDILKSAPSVKAVRSVLLGSVYLQDGTVAPIEKALEGTDDKLRMTPFTTRAVIDEVIGSAGKQSAEAFATAEQGQLAENAVQKHEIGSAAQRDVADFATATQGELAEKAVQPEHLGTAAKQSVESFATAIQGAKAETAVQPEAFEPIRQEFNGVAEAAQTSAAKAEFAAEAAALTGALYNTQALGEAATPVGKVFQSVSATVQGAIEVRLRTAAGSDLRKTVPSSERVALAEQTFTSAIAAVPTYQTDMVPDADIVYVDRLGNIVKAETTSGIPLIGDSNVPTIATDSLEQFGRVDLVDRYGSVVTSIPTVDGIPKAESIKRTGDTYIRAGEVLPFWPDETRAAIWGSSSAAYSGAEFEQLMLSFGIPAYRGGKAQEWSDQICARLGSRPVLLTVTGGSIPTNGSVTVQSTNWAGGIAAIRSYTGTFAGVYGTLSWDPGQTSLVFTREALGDAVAVSVATPMIPDVGLAYRNAITLLWPGKNDLSSGRDLRQIIDNTDNAAAWLSPMITRFLVLGHFADRGFSVANKARLVTINSTHAAKYGRQFVDVQAYLMSDQVWIDTGLTPTADDVVSRSAGELPPSLSIDTGHMNDITETAFMTKIIGPRLKELWNLGL